MMSIENSIDVVLDHSDNASVGGEESSISNPVKRGENAYKTPRISFRGLVFEFLKSSGGWITLSLLCAGGLRLALGGVGLIDLVLFLAIVASWPFFEWFFHRFLLHEWTILPFHFTHHRHHLTPTAATGLPDSWIIGLYFFDSFAFWALGYHWLSTLNFAVIAMLTVYEFVHFSCHCNYKPLTRWGWAIRVNHLQHHRFDESRFYSMLFPITR